MVTFKGSARYWNFLEDYWPFGGLSVVNAIGNAFAWPDKLGTDPMAYGGMNKWTPPRKSGGFPWISTRFSLSVENEQSDAGRDGRTRLAIPNSQARMGKGKYSFSLFSWLRAGLATLPDWSILWYKWWPYINELVENSGTVNRSFGGTSVSDVFFGRNVE